MSSNTQFAYKIPLADLRDGTAIAGAGGSYMVCQPGTAKKQAIYNKTGTQLNVTTAFVALNSGLMEFYVPDTVTSVDIYGMAPDGQFFAKTGLTGSPYQILIDRGVRAQVALVPYAAADSTAASEKDTGMDLPAGALISPFVGIREFAGESGKTLDFGTLSTEASGDANGLVAAISLTAAASVFAKSASTATRGALIGSGTLDVGHIVVAATQSLSYTLSAATASAHGLMIIPYTLPYAF